MPVVIYRILGFKWALHKSIIHTHTHTHTHDMQNYECHTTFHINHVCHQGVTNSINKDIVSRV